MKKLSYRRAQGGVFSCLMVLGAIFGNKSALALCPVPNAFTVNDTTLRSKIKIPTATYFEAKHKKKPTLMLKCSHVANSPSKKNDGQSLRNFFKATSQKAFKLTTRAESHQSGEVTVSSHGEKSSSCIRLSKRQKVSDFVKKRIIKAPMSLLSKLKERRRSLKEKCESQIERDNEDTPNFLKGLSGKTISHLPREERPTVQESMNIVSSAASSNHDVASNGYSVTVTGENSGTEQSLSEGGIGGTDKTIVNNLVLNNGNQTDRSDAYPKGANGATMMSSVVTQVKGAAGATVDVANATLQKTRALNSSYQDRFKSVVKPEIQSKAFSSKWDSHLAARQAEIEKNRQQPKLPREEAQLAAKYGAMTPEDRAYNILLDLGMIDDHSYPEGADDEYCKENIIPDGFTLHLT